MKRTSCRSALTNRLYPRMSDMIEWSWSGMDVVGCSRGILQKRSAVGTLHAAHVRFTDGCGESPLFV